MSVIVKTKYMYIITLLYKTTYNKVKYVLNLYSYNSYDNLLNQIPTNQQHIKVLILSIWH